ncbi:protein disulfide-isomerase [soil metagenome]
MALLDPYSLCPCGSKQKYKWCCQKAEAVAIRVERALQSQLLDQAMLAVEEGLKKDRDNFWLLTRKAMIFESREEPEPALEALRQVLSKMPGHVGARVQMVQYAIQFGNPAAGASALQDALSACKPEHRDFLSGAAQLVGVMLAQVNQVPAALMHLELGGADDEDTDPLVRSTYFTLRSDPVISPWLKHPYDLSPAPAGLDGEATRRFEEAVHLAENGLWGEAATRFESFDREAIAEADRNLGLCRLWMADNQGAVEALRRYIAKVGPTPEAVDLEVLCQLTEPITGDDLIERVQLVWELKDRKGLLATLSREKTEARTVHFEGTAPIDPDDPKSFEVHQYALLDRPLPQSRPDLTPAELPRILGRVIVADKTVALDTFDDDQLDSLKDRFTDLAGTTIPPAHPKTKVTDKLSRIYVTLQSEWVLPKGLNKAEIDRIRGEERRRVYNEIWPETPMPFLGGRTPRQAARDGDAEIPLRAAICQFNYGPSNSRDIVDFNHFREEFGIEPEPVPDLETTDVETLHLARLDRVPANRLDDQKLSSLFLRARSAMIPRALENACRALIGRPALLDSKSPIERFTVFSDLANLVLSWGNKAEALALVDRGRRDEPGPHRTENAPRWDMLLVRLRARSEPPEAWVSELAIILERYKDIQVANTIILSNLLDMGLVQMSPSPDQPDQMILDSRPLMALLSRHGPRITSASGTLGVSAARPEIWTPEQGSGSSGGVWTPGSSPSQGPRNEGEKSNLYLPRQ